MDTKIYDSFFVSKRKITEKWIYFFWRNNLEEEGKGELQWLEFLSDDEYENVVYIMHKRISQNNRMLDKEKDDRAMMTEFVVVELHLG